MGKQLTDNFLPLENAVLEQNALVINTGDQLVLFDTGMGGLKLFGSTTGKLLSSMKQAGIDPKDIDAVVMSHAHIDHCGGCVADDGSPPFPERAILHYAGGLRFLDHRKQRTGPVQSVLGDGDQEPQAEPRTDAVHQRRRGNHSGRARDIRKPATPSAILSS